MLGVFSKKFHKQTDAIFKPGTGPTSSTYWSKEAIRISHKSYPRFPKKELSPNLLSLEISENTLTNINQQKEFDWLRKISFDELSTILHYSTGVISLALKAKNNPINIFYPYGEMRYPLEIYPVIQRVEGMIPGIYHFNVEKDALETISLNPEQMEEVMKSILYDWPKQAAVMFFTTAIWDRNFIQYKGRGYRMALLETGQLNHNFTLLSTALNIHCSSSLGFNNKKINEILDIENEEESSICMTLLGK